MDASDLVFLTSGYKVFALKKSDGQVVWETLLIARFFKPLDPFITLLVDSSGLYAHVFNEVFRLDLLTGNILWHSELPFRKWINTPGIASMATLEAGASAAANPAAWIRANRKSQTSGAD